MKALTKDDLIKLLEIMIEVIKEDDSFEGRVTYTFGSSPGTFEVDAAFRTGNSQGQGGMIIV